MGGVGAAPPGSRSPLTPAVHLLGGTQAAFLVHRRPRDDEDDEENVAVKEEQERFQAVMLVPQQMADGGAEARAAPASLTPSWAVHAVVHQRARAQWGTLLFSPCTPNPP